MVDVRSRGAGRADAIKLRYSRIRERADTTTAGRLKRRIQDLEVMNKALLLSALALILFIPALITLSAVLPLGSDHGLAASWTRRLGLSPEAAHDLRELFHRQQTVSGNVTVLSSIVTIVAAFGWPAELARGYQVIWGLPPQGWRSSWRAFAWLLSFFGVVAAVAASGAIAQGVGGALVAGTLGLPLVLLWAWWTQHFLLGGRVPWRPLFAGAVATAVGLLGLRIVMAVYLPHAITSNYERYGAIGVVFALLSWMIGFSVVMLGGPLAGHTFHLRRTPAQCPAEVGRPH
jgi:membrane protein